MTWYDAESQELREKLKLKDIQVFKSSFKAFDHVSGEWFYSKDYESLAEFFALFDNVQYTIILVAGSES